MDDFSKLPVDAECMRKAMITLREKAGLTQAEVAKAIGADRSRYNQIEGSNVVRLTITQVHRMILFYRSLNIDVDYNFVYEGSVSHGALIRENTNQSEKIAILESKLLESDMDNQTKDKDLGIFRQQIDMLNAQISEKA